MIEMDVNGILSYIRTTPVFFIGRIGHVVLLDAQSVQAVSYLKTQFTVITIVQCSIMRKLQKCISFY